MICFHERDMHVIAILRSNKTDCKSDYYLCKQCEYSTVVDGIHSFQET